MLRGQGVRGSGQVRRLLVTIVNKLRQIASLGDVKCQSNVNSRDELVVSHNLSWQRQKGLCCTGMSYQVVCRCRGVRALSIASPQVSLLSSLSSLTRVVQTDLRKGEKRKGRDKQKNWIGSHPGCCARNARQAAQTTSVLHQEENSEWRL